MVEFDGDKIGNSITLSMEIIDADVELDFDVIASQFSKRVYIAETNDSGS